MADPLDFVVTDYLQRLETWAMVGSRVGLDVEAIRRTAAQYAAAVLVPVCGKAIQKLGSVGFEPDGFMLKSGSFRFAALSDLKRATVVAWLPAQHAGEIEVAVECCGSRSTVVASPGSMFSLELRLDIEQGSEHDCKVMLSSSFQPASLPDGGGDTRHLGCLIQSVEFS